MRRKLITSIIFLLTFALAVNAQRNPLDTLFPKLKKASDAEKAALYNKIGKEYVKASYDSGMKYYNLALELSKKKDVKTEEALANHNIGLLFYGKKNYPEALKHYNNAIDIREKIKDADGLGKTYNNIGIIQFETGNYDQAIEAYQKASQFKEETKDTNGIANTLNNIANVYIQKGQNENAILYLQKALKFFEKLKNKESIYKCLNGIGVTYGNIGQDKYPTALQFETDALKIAIELDNPVLMAQSYSNIGNTMYSMEDDSIKKKKLNIPVRQRYSRTLNSYLKALELRKKIGDKRDIANSLGNIGIIYADRREYATAIDYYNQALAINTELNNPFEMTVNYKELGRIYNYMGNSKKALEYLHQGLDISRKINALSLENSCCYILSGVYEKLEDYREAFRYNKRYSELQDTLWNMQSTKSIAEMQTKYDTEKMQHQKELAEKETAAQKRIIYLGAAVLLVIFSALVVVFRLLVQIRKKNVILREQKAEIEAQRDEIEKQRDIAEKQRDMITEQKKEITDSIHYAQRIQRAILPQDENILAHFPDHFVLFRPRDIVSGDFYWFAYHKEKIIIAAADCTGHGVPGAFMSMLGVTILNELVKNSDATPQANNIVTRLREVIISTLSQSSTSATSTKDGMDIGLCVVDKKTMKLEFAGAHNPLYMIRNGELTEYDADHMPVGVYEVMDPFTNNVIDMQKGDSYFIFSDGFSDQFGGPKGKKFKSKQFKELLLSIHDKPLKEQGELIEKVRLEWLGEEYEQIDDVCVIGFRV